MVSKQITLAVTAILRMLWIFAYEMDYMFIIRYDKNKVTVQMFSVLQIWVISVLDIEGSKGVVL